MDEILDALMLALQLMIAGKATRIIAGEAVIQLIVPGLIFIHLGERNYVYEAISGSYILREAP